MKVVCKYCGKSIEKKYSFLVKKGNQNFYYCSETHYQNHELEKEYHKDMINITMDIFGEVLTHTSIYKELSELEDIYGVKLILDYLTDNQVYLINVLKSKSFSSQYAKIRYFTAILKNNLADYRDNNRIYDNTEDEDKDIEIEIYEHKYKQKKKRRTISEIEMGFE